MPIKKRKICVEVIKVEYQVVEGIPEGAIKLEQPLMESPAKDELFDGFLRQLSSGIAADPRDDEEEVYVWFHK